MIFRFLLAVGLILSASLAAAQNGIAFDQRPGWLHQETWMHDSQGNVEHDLAQAARMGKSLMILWEQQGCTYCDRLHAHNFTKPEIRTLLEENFLLVPLNMHGQRRVLAPDGTEMTEADLARRLQVTGTPTTVVFNTAQVLKKAPSAEAFRMPGYLKSFHYLAVLAYFLSDRHDEMTLQQYVALQANEFRERGINPDRW